MQVLLDFKASPMPASHVETSCWTCSMTALSACNRRVAKRHCCLSAPSEPDLSLSRHPAQAHHERHGSFFSSCFGLSGACVFLCQFSVVELLAVSHSSFSLRMDVLMTEQVNQCQVAVVVFAPL